MWSLANMAIGLLVVGLLVTRQLQPRLAKESSSVRLVAILAVFGVIETRNAIGAHTVPVTALAWLGLSLVAGAGMGAIRAATVRVWRLTPTMPLADRPPNPQMSSSHKGRSVPCAPCHR